MVAPSTTFEAAAAPQSSSVGSSTFINHKLSLKDRPILAFPKRRCMVAYKDSGLKNGVFKRLIVCSHLRPYASK